jgi:PatG Domain
MEAGETSGEMNSSEESIVTPAEDASPRSSPAIAAPLTPPAALPESAPRFVYALGRIDARFPSLSIEKEFAQVIGASESSGVTERQNLKRAMSERENRYLARNLCWVLEIGGLETYILAPRDPTDLDLLMEAYREEPRADDLDLVIGVRTEIAPPEMCNGLALPVVIVDHLYSFDRDSLIDSIPAPESLSAKALDKFRAAAREQFRGLVQIADNAGALDEHRALNYLAVRYPRIYAVAAEKLEGNASFAGVAVQSSPLSGARSIVDVVFSYRHRQTDVVEKEFVRVDVTEQFPFLVTKMGPYFGQ